MKFHCDRCKTRYSIADERVRGKILKIRCKNCAAVITVKESGSNTSVELVKPAAGGGAAAPAAARPAAPRPAVPRPAAAAPSRPVAGAGGGAPGAAVAARRAQAPAIPAAAARAPARAPAAAARPAASARPASALQGAFANALKRSPADLPASESLTDAPAVLEAEWYVSLDGDQFGPYSLHQAQDWVARQELDEELYCWSEGFDDWLPVEKVSHFRGMRGGEGGPTVAQRDPFGESDRTMVDAPPDAATPGARGLPAPRREDTPVPLFAATMAQMAAEAPTEIDEPAIPKRNGASPAAPAVKPSLPAPSRDGRPSPAGGAARLPLPAARPAPLPSPTRSKPQSAGPVPSGPLAAKPAGVPMTPMADEPSAAASLEFEIGEASRVVKLPMLGQHLARAGNAAAAPLASPGLPGVKTESPPSPASPSASSSVGRGTGSFNPPPGAAHLTQTGAFLPVIQGGGTVEIPRPEILQPKRGSKSMFLPIVIGGGVLLTAVVILLYVAMSGGDDEDGERLARGRVGGDGLAYQFQDDDKDGRDDKTGKTQEETVEAAQKSITTRRTIKPRGGTSAGGTPQARDPGAIGIDETDLNAGSGAFDPDQFFEVYKKNTLGVNLCYNSALKKDPLLSVTNAQVFLTVKTDGTVASVSIPALTGTDLGGCLTKRIKSWRFPKSTDGGSGVLKVIFKS